jgi:hypothetical protein
MTSPWLADPPDPAPYDYSRPFRSAARVAWFSFCALVWALSNIPGDNAKRRVESAGYPPHRTTANYTRRYLLMSARVVATGLVIFGAVSFPLAFIAIALVACAAIATFLWRTTRFRYDPNWPEKQTAVWTHGATTSNSAIGYVQWSGNETLTSISVNGEAPMISTLAKVAPMTHATNLPLQILEQTLLEIRKSGFRQGERDVIQDEGPCNLYEALLRVIAPTPEARHAIYYGGGYDVSAPTEPTAKAAYDALVSVTGEDLWIWQDRDGRTQVEVERAILKAIDSFRQ